MEPTEDKVATVLVVEDNEGDRFLANHYLTSSGRFEHILHAEDGRVALDLFEQWADPNRENPDHFPPDVVLLDINMPRVDGFEFLKQVQAMGLPPVRVVVLSSSEFNEDIQQARSFPMVKDYLVKPLSGKTVTKMADEVLGSR